MNALWVITGAAVLGGAVVVAVQATAARLRRQRGECGWCRYWARVECSCPVPCKAPHCGAREVRR